MNKPTYVRSPLLGPVLLFTLSVASGWCVFNLQIISLVRLLQEVGIEVLPFLMILQACFSWVLLRVWGNAALGSSSRFLYSALALGALTSLVAHIGFQDEVLVPYQELIFGVLFILSQLSISALRMGIHVVFSKQISVLKTPQISTQLSIAEESGFLLGVLALWFSPGQTGMGAVLLSLFPFAAAVAGVRIMKSRQGESPLKQLVPDPEADKGLIRRLKTIGEGVVRPILNIHYPITHSDVKLRSPYLGWLVGLFTVVAFLKSFQWFGMAYGLAEASKEGAQILNIFSRMALVQSAFTLTILVASLRFSSKIPTWTIGFRVLLTAQGVANSFLTFFPLPYPLMSAEISRKVLEHGFLGRSLQLLTSSIPDEDRLEIRHMLERWSTTSGTLLAGFVALLSIHGFMPIWFACFCSVMVAALGLKLHRNLFQTLSDFHIARLNQDRLQGVIQACYVLGTQECRHHHAALTGLLERNPRPAITKAVIHALGRMNHPAVIPAIKPYLKHDREDVQLAAIRALHHHRGHEVNLALLILMRDLIRSEMALRFNVVKVLTERLGRLAIPYLLEVLENPLNDRVAANTVEILGGIAQAEGDEDLMDYLAKFLDNKYPSRIRSNAILALYHHRVHWEKALESFDRLLTSRHAKELDALAYICGMLKLRGHESFIWRLSENAGHRDATLLISLLRLGNIDAPKLLAEWLIGPSERQAYVTLVRLSTVSVKTRAQVLYEITENHPEHLDLVLLRMRASQRDFEADRDLIREEAKRLGVGLMEESAWANQDIMKSAPGLEQAVRESLLREELVKEEQAAAASKNKKAA